MVACAPAALAAWLGPRSGSVLHAAGRSAALTGATILALQAVLAARWKWASRPFGLDVVYRFHRRMAVLGGVLLVAHPFLLAGGGAGASLLFSLDVPWSIWLGRGVLLALLANLAISTWSGQMRVTFERWRLAHGVLAVFLLAGALAHSWALGGDLGSVAFRAVWVAVIAAGLAIFVHHRLIRPVLRRRHPYRVTNVIGEADGVWTVELEPPGAGPRYEYLPGQFHFITLHRGRGLPEEEHHFTISSSAETGRVTSTIKAVGDFTSTIGDTRPGDTASVQGAFGRFSYRLRPDEKDLVFIVGGIGITPLMSMLRTMRDRRDAHRVLLLYGNRNEASIVFRDELAEIEAGEHPDLKVVHALSRPGEQWTGESGHIDRRMIDRYVGGEVAGKTFYVCGPTPLREAAISNLKDMGVSGRQIRIELFSLVD